MTHQQPVLLLQLKANLFGAPLLPQAGDDLNLEFVGETNLLSSGE